MGNIAPPERMYLLDFMRGIAAVAVVHFHAAHFIGIADSGYLAVDFFFALSGFVIWRAYADRLRRGLSFPTFVRMRLRRLYPIFSVGVLLGLAVFSLRAVLGLGSLAVVAYHLLFNLFVLPVPFIEGNIFPLNSPSWTLFLELIANFALAIAIRKITPLRLAALMLAAAVLLLWAIFAEGNVGGWEWRTIHIGVLRLVFSFSLGLLLANFSITRKAGWASLLIVLALVCVLYMQDTPETMAFIAAVTIFLVNPVLLWLAVSHELPKVLWPVGKFFGDISYPLYATHLPVLMICYFVTNRFRLDGIPAMAFVTLVTITVATIVNFAVGAIMKGKREASVPGV